MSRAVSIKQILAGIMNLLIDLFIFSSVHFTAFLDSFHFSDISSKNICRLVLSIAVQIVQWFQPGVWFFKKAVREYSEFACDEGVCERAGGRKVYFVETKKKKPLVCAVSLSIAISLCGSVSVAAAADGIGRQYQKWYKDTLVEVEEVYEPVEYEEFTDHGPAEGIKEEIGETEQVTRRMKTFTWNVGSRIIKKTAEFSESKGQKIFVTVLVEPSTKTVKVGIVDSSGNRRYVTGKQSISHMMRRKRWS